MAGAATLVFRGPEAETRGYWTTIVPPAGVTIRDTTGTVPARRLALSPDGRWLAFTASTGDGRVQLWVRSLDGLAAPLAGTDGATYPIWSPEGSRLVFVSSRKGPGDLYEKPSTGGTDEEPLFADSVAKTPLSWSPDGQRILYATVGKETLSRHRSA
jgi:dipeptidyl aminopeptidase/acylaminoacyl peptidase